MKPLPVTVYRSPLRQASASEVLAHRVLAFAGICAILYFGRDVLIPVVLAVLLAVLLAPAVRHLQRLHLPKGAAVVVIVATALVIVLTTAYAVGSSLTSLAGDLPRYETNLREKARTLRSFASGSSAVDKAAGVLTHLQTELTEKPAGAPALGENDAQPIPVVLHDGRFGSLEPVVSVIEIVAHPLVQLAIVVLMLTFILFNREDLRSRLIRLTGTGDLHKTTVALDEAGSRLSRLFIGQMAINAGVGAVLGAALFLLGIPGAVLWGLLAAILRFVPFVGTFLAAIFPIVIALAVGDGWTLPLIVAAVVLVAEFTASNVAEPLVLGKMTGVSSVAIIVAAAFWATLWGPVGLVLATPITIGLLVIGRHIESLHFLDVLFGSEPVLSPDHILYQRLLAGDALEAAEAAAEYQKEERLAEYLEDVAIPALSIAAADLQRGVLPKDKAREMAATFSDLLDDLWSDETSFERDPAPVLVIANHGPVNFAAAVAYSALLTLRRVPHRMLAEDAAGPAKFPDVDTSALQHVCLVSHTAPTAAQYDYIARRLAARIGASRILNIAWVRRDGAGAALAPLESIGLLPQEPPDGDQRGGSDVTGAQPVAA